MPANLPPQYVKLEEEYRREKDSARRLELLQEMLREIPKHKGTNHLQGELKSKISKLRTELETGRKSGGTRHAVLDHIPREGAGQFVLIGPANSGKSSIVGALTNAHVEIAEWPFATRKAIPGMAKWENVKLQLIDTPSIAPEFADPHIFGIIRAADVAVVVVSLADDDLLEELEHVVHRVQEAKTRLTGLAASDPRYPTTVDMKTMLVATGHDQPNADTRLSLLLDSVSSEVPIIPVAVPSREGLEEFLARAFALLELHRVYTKAPGKLPDLDDPVLLPRQATVADAARSIHKDIADRLLFARIWSRAKPSLDGTRVPSDHVVEDGDILEFHV